VSHKLEIILPNVSRYCMCIYCFWFWLILLLFHTCFAYILDFTNFWFYFITLCFLIWFCYTFICLFICVYRRLKYISGHKWAWLVLIWVSSFAVYLTNYHLWPITYPTWLLNQQSAANDDKNQCLSSIVRRKGSIVLPEKDRTIDPWEGSNHRPLVITQISPIISSIIDYAFLFFFYIFASILKRFYKFAFRMAIVQYKNEKQTSLQNMHTREFVFIFRVCIYLCNTLLW
jgi:hypothetical protein